MIRPPTNPLRRLPQPPARALRSTWRDASPRRIERALELAQQRNPGGWLVAGASRDLRTESVVRHLAGREVAVWRGADGTVHAGPGACPHLGAKLEACTVAGQDLLCRWHGMALPREAGGGWREFLAYDDGVLLWVRLPLADEQPTERPLLPERPPVDGSIAAVVSVAGTCEPADILANRLDPWHGAWFHPYAFSHLRVVEEASTEDALVVEVAFRINRTWGVPVLARFTTPDARTITMQIVEGEGAGSVVETHATPLGPDREGRPRTMMTEATIAHSPRPGFLLARRMGPLVRPLIRRSARQLWVDDLAYAERRFALREAR
ncbi:2Fe-2S ferredoxin [Enemella dayhoffiae]|uniref:2Fe-2S ferredoxin n=1 Tax=Enemella dayhoffiae TaxID=2016507 RepID=A0A255GUP8_9ACTN|nr:DUF5914 domain-containing protein [Enemella dayhoffiae]OYO18313.1 2Fe-2S ferredoxin [Enemella dayhoffiae]